MAKIVGIDLGTTNSVVAVMEGKEVKVIPNAQGSALTPSIVAFTAQGERLVGQMAKRQSVMNPRNTVFSIKRFMGRRRNEVGEEEKMVPYEITGSGSDPVRVKLQGKDYTPQEISAMVLQSLKETAEAYLGEKVEAAVITCPAYFNDSQRQATKEAGKIAGFDVKRIINEPTAAALAYGMSSRKKKEKIAVYDLGGGTFDISILEVDNELIEVLSTNGNTHLGGDDFDQRLIDHLAEEFQKEHGTDLRKDPTGLQRLKEACEKAKCELSSMVETEINLPFVSMDTNRNPLHLTAKISRSKFEQLVGDLVEGTLDPVRKALADAKLNPGEIGEVILVGGSTRIPKVQSIVKEFFGKEPNRSVNPDEVVAAGAAIQGAVLSGDVKDILLLDVTPLTLGIETLGGVRTPLINRNTTIPTKKSQVFSTAGDNQPSVDVHVVQGEREMASACRTLGKFHLDGIPPAPRGMPQIEVTFDIDANGILNVSAKDLGTNKEQSIRITASTGLSEEEVNRMVTDAESHAEDDKKQKELIETRNQADALVYGTEKAIKEHGEKISAEEKSNIEAAAEKLKKIKDGDNLDEIKKTMEELTTASHAMSKVIYEEANKQQQKEAGGPQAPPPSQKPSSNGDTKKDEKIIDADFEAK